MDKLTRSISIFFAVVIFFVMAAAGMLAGRSAGVCCYRAVTGGIIAFVVVTFAGKVVIAIIVEAILKSKS